MAEKTKRKNEVEVGSTLRNVNPIHSKYYDEWRFLNAAYEGVRALIAWGALFKHERESTKNYNNRVKAAYGFSYSKSIVDIFNSYLFKKEFPTEIPEPLTNDEQWKQFQKDCDLEGSTFNNFFVDEQRNASILGHVGLLVDKPSVEKSNRAEELEAGIYPYVVAYKPMAILDWRVERDEFGRKRLTYLKVLDDDNRYRVWTLTTWEIWELQTARGSDNLKVGEASQIGAQPTQAEVAGKGTAAVKVDEGENPLGEIPFVLLYNQKSNIDKEVGVSDINDVSRIDASIIRNLSQIEEIIDYAAFPMMRKPMKEGGSPKNVNDDVGVEAVLEFDPENPDSKPDWLSAEVAGPIEATLSVIQMKISEIYRSSNIGGMSATEVSKSAKSGVALRTEFQLLNSKLVKKGKNVAKAKYDVTRLWLMWQEEWDKYNEEIIFDHISSFELEDLATDLENALTSTVIVNGSETYSKEIQKSVVRMILPQLDEQTLAEVDKEIDAGTYTGIGDFFGGGETVPGEEDEDEIPTREEVVGTAKKVAKKAAQNQSK